MAIEIVESTNTPNEGRIIWNDNFIELEGSINELNPDGIAWVFQAGPPDSSDGFDGDMYFDTTNAIFYGPKVDGEWPAEGVEVSGGSDATWNPVKAATTADITLSGTQTIDGVSCFAGNRVLVMSQTDATQNGIYTVATGAWSRATDAGVSADFLYGKMVFIGNQGFENHNQIGVFNSLSPFTLGSDDVNFILAIAAATETQWGTSKTATQSEVNAGTAGTDLMVTPEKLAAYTGVTNKLLTTDYQARDAKDSVRVATTANITLSGTQTIDGISVVAGNRVLVKNQSTGSQNGIYLCASGAWTRTTDADTSAKLTPQMYTRVEEGTANGSKEFYLSNTGSITLGTTALTFAERAGGAVSSVFTRTGAVVAVSGDYTATQITNTPAGSIAATTVQAALNELDTEKASATSVSDHLADASDAHDGSAVSFVPTGSIAATNVQAAIEEVASEAGSGSGIASVDGVSNPGGNIDLVAGSNVTITPDDTANTITFDSTGGGTTLPVADTTAIVKDATDNTKLVRVEAGAIATGTTRVINMPNADVSLGDIADHIADTSAAHAASAVGFTPAGTIAATNVQAAIEEVASEASGGSAFDPTTTAEIYEDFVGGIETSAQVGTHGWRFSGGSSVVPTSDANFVGAFGRSTGASAIISYCWLHPAGASSPGHLYPTQTFDLRMRFMVTVIDANARYYIGLHNDWVNDPAHSGIMLERRTTDTNWQYVIRTDNSESGANVSRTDSGVAAVIDTWITVRMRRIDSSHIGFSLNGGSETSVAYTTQLDNTTLALGWQVKSSSAVDRRMYVDYAHYKVTGLSR